MKDFSNQQMVILDDKIDINTIKNLLPNSCLNCLLGRKKTIYTTFNCNRSCYYCSAPSIRLGISEVLIGKKKINLLDTKNIGRYFEDIKEIVISGGEPLIDIKKTDLLIRILHDNTDASITLYTNGDLLSKKNSIQLIINNNLTVKVSFHDFSFQGIDYVFDTFPKIFFEIPGVPGMEEEIISLIHMLDLKKHHFILIDELQFTPHNKKRLLARGFVQGKNNAVSGSMELCNNVAEYITNTLPEFSVIVCPVNLRKHTYGKLYHD